MLKGVCPSLTEESHRSEIVVALIVMTALSLLAVISRIVSRRIARTKLWWDDYLISFAMVGFNLDPLVMCHWLRNSRSLL